MFETWAYRSDFDAGDAPVGRSQPLRSKLILGETLVSLEGIRHALRNVHRCPTDLGLSNYLLTLEATEVVGYPDR